MFFRLLFQLLKLIAHCDDQISLRHNFVNAFVILNSRVVHVFSRVITIAYYLITQDIKSFKITLLLIQATGLL